ncbi:hypothetical protein ACTMU2_18955 [Cupriavidus basilensis]
MRAGPAGMDGGRRRMEREPLEASDGAVMFADLSGGELYEVAGNAAAMAAVGRCLDVMRSCSQACGSRIVKTIGDEIMVLFPRRNAPCRPALDMQHAVSSFRQGVRCADVDPYRLSSWPVLSISRATCSAIRR